MKPILCTQHWTKKQAVDIFECIHCEFAAKKRVAKWWGKFN